VLDVATTRKVLAVVLATAMLAVVIFAGLVGWKNRGQGLFPARRRLWVPWELGDILIAWVAINAGPLVFFAILTYTGFFRWWYGEDLTTENNPTKGNLFLLQRCSLWAMCFAMPFSLSVVLGWLRMRGIGLWQLGLTKWRLGNNLASGCLAAIVLTPTVLAVNYFMNMFYLSILQTEPGKHAYMELANQVGSLELVWLVLGAVVSAPLLEELFFRGLLLPWMAERWWSPALAWSVSLLVAGFTGKGWHPVIFAAVAGLPMLAGLVRKKTEYSPIFAIYGSSLLFAVAHSHVWPSPVPLLLLGCGLGYLRDRTRSLVAPVVLHSLFNAVSTWLMLTSFG